MNKAYPYKEKLMDEKIWWPESSRDDRMVIGDGIPGDRESARLCARCCNIAYKQAIEDFAILLRERDIYPDKMIKILLRQ